MKAGDILAEKPQIFTNEGKMARAIFDQLGGKIRLALPLGLGKPVTLVNALTRAAISDPTLRLSIFTVSGSRYGSTFRALSRTALCRDDQR